MDFDGEKQRKTITEIRCVVCLEKFANLKNLIICALCESVACKLHWTMVSNLTFCDLCLKNDMIKEAQTEYLAETQRLKAELKGLQGREEATLAEISKKALLIPVLEKNLIEKQGTCEKSLRDLNQDLRKTMENTLTLEQEIPKIKQNIIDLDCQTSKILEKTSHSSVEISQVSRENSLLTTEVADLVTELENLVKKCNETIPYRRVRNTACIKCHNSIKDQLREEIISLLQTMRTDSLMKSLMINRPSQKSQNPCTCLII